MFWSYLALFLLGCWLMIPAYYNWIPSIKRWLRQSEEEKRCQKPYFDFEYVPLKMRFDRTFNICVYSEYKWSSLDRISLCLNEGIIDLGGLITEDQNQADFLVVCFIKEIRHRDFNKKKVVIDVYCNSLSGPHFSFVLDREYLADNISEQIARDILHSLRIPTILGYATYEAIGRFNRDSHGWTDESMLQLKEDELRKKKHPKKQYITSLSLSKTGS